MPIHAERGKGGKTPAATVYITKYGLTQGILIATVESYFSDVVVVHDRSGINGTSMFYAPDCHRTEAEAIDRLEKMRAARITALQKQIDKLRHLKNYGMVDIRWDGNREVSP
jgi:hypothetical protein